MIRRPRVAVAKKFGRSFLFVAANADADHTAIVVADGKLKNLLCSFSAKLPDRVENPKQRNPEVALTARATAIQSFGHGGKSCLRHRQTPTEIINLGVQNIFFSQMLHQPMSDDLVIFRRPQMLRDVLERQQKTGKIGIAVNLVNLGE